MKRFPIVIATLILSCCFGLTVSYLYVLKTRSSLGTAATKVARSAESSSTPNASASAASTSSVDSTSLAPHNLYNLPTPENDDTFGCYEQQGDKVIVYLDGRATVLRNADVQTFQDLSPFDNCFGKDKNSVYFYDQVLGWADPLTFTVLTYFRGPTLFLRNVDEILSWKPGWLPDGSRPTEVNSDCMPGVSEGFCLIPHSDAKTFQVISGGYDIPPWAKDKQNVYCGGAVVQGADPSTAQLINQDRYLRVMVDGMARIYNGCTIVDATST